MRISRIHITNFRNFRVLGLDLAGNAVIVGENKIGKTNLLYALRLVLDPSLPDSARQLQNDDFWDGLARPLTRADKITIAVDLTDFEGNEDHVALLAEHLVEPEPMTARLTYVFQPLETLEGEPMKESDYEFVSYGGDRPDSHFGFEIRRGLPMDLLPALRDSEGDLANWRRSPLRPLLDGVAGRIDGNELAALAAGITAATGTVADNEEVRGLVGAINDRVRTMVGPTHAVDTTLGFSPTDPERLLRALRLFIDAGKREIGAASLGSANVLYLTLQSTRARAARRRGPAASHIPGDRGAGSPPPPAPPTARLSRFSAVPGRAGWRATGDDSPDHTFSAYRERSPPQLDRPAQKDGRRREQRGRLDCETRASSGRRRGS